MDSNPSVTTWLTIRDGCPLSYEVGGSADTEFIFGGNPIDGFGLTMQADALREFLKVGAKALDEMNELFEQEQS